MQFVPLELCDRAVRFLAERGVARQDEVLAEVYGGPAPPSLSARLAAPLLADPRLEQLADGWWTLRSPSGQNAPTSTFTALALVATGPTPTRARVVRISALHHVADQVIERFDATLNPGKRVPRYVAERVGLELEVLNVQPAFADILDELVRFLGERPVLAQDVQLTWAFLAAEARSLGRTLVVPTLLDLNEQATRLLNLTAKPSLGRVAAQLGIGSVDITHPDEEARVLGLVGARLLAMGTPPAADTPSTTLRRGATARALPDEPGVYVLRDREQVPLYVGKARRLRSRLASYVHRPLGATRRMEGLVGAVHGVDSTQCATDLEALILEDREIRRLQPRFNTVRRQRSPRFWIRLPPATATGRRVQRRLELSAGPGSVEGDFVGPFRNESVAQQARALARQVFELDALRRTDPSRYAERLALAWAFLRGESGPAEELARHMSVDLLRRVVPFDVARLLLPADPRRSRYAVVRPGPAAIEGFVLDQAIFLTWTVMDDDDTFAFAQQLLVEAEPRTTPDDVDVVLRWFGAQRPPARLVWLPDDLLAAADAIESAAVALLELTTWKT